LSSFNADDLLLQRFPKDDITGISKMKSIRGTYDHAQTARNCCLIINNTHFKSATLSARAGSNNDEKLLTTFFGELNFEVISKPNLTRAQMIAECNSGKFGLSLQP
jgi:hypothetical protein